MIRLRLNKLAQGEIFNHNRLFVVLLQGIQKCLCRLPLLLSEGIDARAVLNPDIHALPAQRGRVDGIAIFPENFCQRDFFRIKDNLDRFGVSAVIADLLIGDAFLEGRIPEGLFAQSIADPCFQNTINTLHIFFRAPEAAACQINRFFFHKSPLSFPKCHLSLFSDDIVTIRSAVL